MRGTTLCISHNPAAAETKRAAVRKGGRNRRTPQRAPKAAKAPSVRTIDDVQSLVFRTLEELRNGTLDAGVARSIGYLAGIAAKIVETVELTRRVSDAALLTRGRFSELGCSFFSIRVAGVVNLAVGDGLRRATFCRRARDGRGSARVG